MILTPLVLWSLTGLGLVCGSPLAASAEPPTETLPTIEVRVDTRELGDELGPRIRSTLEPGLEAKVSNQDLTVVPRRGDTVLEVWIVLVDPDLANYEIRFDLSVDGQWRSVVEPVICEACSEQRLVDKTLGLVPDIEGHLLAAMEQTQADLTERGADAVEGESEGEDGVAFTDPVLVPQHQPLQLGPLGLGGAVMLTAGVFAGLGGWTLMGLPAVDNEKTRKVFGPNADGIPDWTRSPRVVGQWVSVAGGAVAALGILALVVDRTVIRRCCRNWPARVTPTMSGLMISGSF